MSSFDTNEIKNNNAFWYDKILVDNDEFTTETYDADFEYRENISALEAFYADPENYLAPEYGKLLKEKIRKFEEDNAQQNMNEEEYCFPDDYADQEQESYEDMAEQYRLDRLESSIENARDDMRDDD
jgi:hypothetical protein